ncbi:hypothetical protein MKW92_012842, partial [Papaver armeniacum]
YLQRKMETLNLNKERRKPKDSNQKGNIQKKILNIGSKRRQEQEFQRLNLKVKMKNC